MSNRIENLTIVGGGTAGWLTANLLARTLNWRSETPVNITVIESPNVPRIGVGESTVPAMPQMLLDLGVDESEFIRRCNASFKLGALFVGWDLDKQGKPIVYTNPFTPFDDISGYHPAYYYNKYGPTEGSISLCDSALPIHALINERRGPRMLHMNDYEYVLGYAYHLDAALFAELMRDIAVQRGIQYIPDDVVDVQLDEKGFVSSLQLKENGKHDVEFVIDCTGFKGLIMNKVLEEPFESFSKYFLVDKAIAVQTPHKDPQDMKPCTTATALGAGWAWNVPLYTRVGNGYVFSSQFRSDDEAMDEFLQHVGADAKEHNPRILPFRLGKSRRTWVKNCMAIGLSGGFVEPLEATAIAAIERAARWLFTYFPDKDVSPVLADQVNRLMDRLFDEIRDFILLHYYTSNRPDPFWQAARNDITVPDSLKEKLELWKYTLPTPDNEIGNNIFGFENYTTILFGKHYFDGQHFPAEDCLTREDWDNFGREMNAAKQNLVTHLPSHYELLTHIRNNGAGN